MIDLLVIALIKAHLLTVRYVDFEALLFLACEF